MYLGSALLLAAMRRLPKLLPVEGGRIEWEAAAGVVRGAWWVRFGEVLVLGLWVFVGVVWCRSTSKPEGGVELMLG